MISKKLSITLRSLKKHSLKTLMKDIILKLNWFFKSVIKKTLSALKKIGFSKFIGSPLKHFLHYPILYQWDRVLINSAECIPNKPINKKVLIAPVTGFYEAPLAIETLIAKALQIRGADVRIMSCSYALPAYAKDPAGNNNPYFFENKFKKFAYNELDLCKLSDENINAFCTKLGLDQLKLEHFERHSDIEDAESFLREQNISFSENIYYKSINISEHSKSTALRVLARGSLEETDHYHKAIYYRYLLSSIKYIDLLERSLKDFKPMSIFAIHGIYLEHGILTDFARKEGIPIYIWGTPYRQDTIELSVNDTYHRTFLTESDAIWENLVLNDKKKIKLDKYMQSKLAGGRDNVNYHPNPILDKQTIIDKLDIDQTKPLISLFTNVLWDAQIFYPSSIFDDLLDWLNQSIKFSMDNNIQLAVRIHPAESKGGFTTDQPIAKEIRKMFDHIPSNIKIIEPDNDISSYILSDISDLSVVYGSNISLEIALRANPLLIVGEAFCRNKGFSKEPDSIEHYFKILKEPFLVKANTPEQVARARKYAYHFNFRRGFDFPYVSTAVSGKNTSRDAYLNINNLDDLKKGKNKGLDIVTNLLLGESDKYYDDR